MRRGWWSIQGSITRSASSRSRSRPGPRTGVVTRARCRVRSIDPPSGDEVIRNGRIMTVVSGSVTVGIDIGTTAVKAVAADETGAVLARARIPHRLMTPAPDQLEHDAGQAWRRGPVRALAQVSAGLDDLAAVCVTSMVPSLTAVDGRGIPRSAGLLYGDARGRRVAGPDGAETDSVMPDAGGFVRWARHEVPGARGYWPAQAVANYALGRVP